MNIEIWKDIDYGKYQVSSHGRVKSLIFKKEKILKPQLHKKGYYYIQLMGDKGFAVHRLVAMAFIPNLNNLPEINHKDCNRANNYYENLEWSTHGDNIAYSYAKGMRDHKGDKHPQRILNSNQVKQIRSEYIPHKNSKELAERLGVTIGYIWRIATNKTWNHI